MNLRFRPPSLLLLFVLAPALSAQEPQFGPMREDRGTENRLCDLQKIHLVLTLDEQAKTIEGHVTNTFVSLRSPLESVWFDVEGLEITKVTAGGRPATHRLDGARLQVDLPEPIALGKQGSVTIHYHGTKPKKGLYFIEPSADAPDLHPEIWSQGEDENNRYWIPTWDYPSDRATFEGEFTVREPLTVVSNGKLIEKRPGPDGWNTYHYVLDFPFVTYLISICVGDYECYTDDFRGIPVEYYVQRGVGEATARRSFGNTPAMLAFFSDMIGVLYPYPKYSQVAVQNFVVGGMENISATSQTDRTLHDEREELDKSSDGLVAHELSHQWWGDYLTCRTWRHLWLNEGFATYFDALYTEHARGRDAFRLQMRGTQRSAIGRDRPGNFRPLVESFFNRAKDGGGGNNVYVKGGSVLHMIRSVLGDDLWWRAIRHYASRDAGELVDTNDFQVSIEDATGYNLHWLFEEYVYLPGHPKFEIAKSYDSEAHELVLQVKQVQERKEMVPLFRYPVKILVACREGTELHTVWVSKAEEEIRLSAPSEPLMVRFNEGSGMLAEVDFPKSAEELAYQALHDEDVVGRMAAVEKIAKAGNEKLARETLLSVLVSKDHEEVRAQAASRAAGLGGEPVVAALLDGLRDRSPKVRRECARGLGQVHGGLADREAAVVAGLATLVRTELSYQTQISAMESLGHLGGTEALGVLREASDYASPDDRLAQAALQARIRLEDKEAADEILALTEQDHPLSERRRGFRMLGQIGDQLGEARQKIAAKRVIEALHSDESPVQRGAIAAAGRLHLSEAKELLEKFTESQENETRSRRMLRFVARRALQQIEKAEKQEAEAPVPSSATLPDLAKAVEQLTRDVKALTTRLEALEKKGK